LHQKILELWRLGARKKKKWGARQIHSTGKNQRHQKWTEPGISWPGHARRSIKTGPWRALNEETRGSSWIGEQAELDQNWEENQLAKETGRQENTAARKSKLSIDPSAGEKTKHGKRNLALGSPCWPAERKKKGFTQVRTVLLRQKIKAEGEYRERSECCAVTHAKHEWEQISGGRKIGFRPADD
jgi:hypothetical protein